jgi:hypothetical protein
MTGFSDGSHHPGIKRKMAKKAKKKSTKPRKTAAKELLDALASTGDCSQIASLSKKFRRGGSDKVRLMQGIERLARKKDVALDGNRLGEFLALFASGSFTAKSFVGFLEISFPLARSLSRPGTKPSAESHLLSVFINQCAKPPRGFGKIEAGTVTRIVSTKNISPKAVAYAIRSGPKTIAAGARIPWLTEAVCGLVAQQRAIDAAQADALIASLLDFPQQDTSLSPLVVSVALLCSHRGKRSGRPASLLADDIPDALELLVEVYDDEPLALSVGRLKEELSSRHEEIVALGGKIRALDSDLSSRIRESARQDANWNEKFEKLASELDESRTKIKDLQGENTRQGRYAMESEKLLKRKWLSGLEQKLVKPGNDTAILLRRMLENAETDLQGIRRLAVNFSKLHKELNRLAESDASHELTTAIMKNT